MRSSRNSRPLTLAQIAATVGAELHGDGNIVVHGVAPIELAQSGQISFVANQKYTKYILTTQASALVLAMDTPCGHMPVLRHKNPYAIFARILTLLYPESPNVPAGIHPSAVIEDGATIDPSAGIGPFCHIRAGANIGERVQLVSNNYVGPNVTIGEDSIVFPGVRILDDCRIGQRCILHPGVVVGSDGFGFAPSERGIEKIPQVGWVEIADDVEIGSNSTIDRGAIGPTRIGKGTKIDNLVMIAHNVEIGQHCFIVAQVGIAGSTKVGNNSILAGQVGLIGHLEIGNNVKIGAQAGVANSVPDNTTMLGSPAREIHEMERIFAAMGRLPDLLKRVRQLEKKSGVSDAE